MSTHAIPLGAKCPHMPIFIGGQMSGVLGGGGICPYTLYSGIHTETKPYCND